jgi:hypothetical protein
VLDYFVQQLGRGLLDIHERNSSRGLKSIFDFDVSANLEGHKELEFGEEGRTLDEIN